MTDQPAKDRLFSFSTQKDHFPWFALFAIVLTAVIALNLQGRVWWCEAGDYLPWAWNIWSQHNSQHAIDPYTFTHILHGIFEFWILGVIFPRVPVIWRLVMAVAIESSWEIGENTTYVINRYRESTVSLDYYGDSIINSISDILACFTGFLIAYKLRFWRSLAVFLATEIILMLWIRDSLLINVIMLIWPIEAIKKWQTGV